MEGFANDLSRTLSLSNQYLTLMLEEEGLGGLAPSHGEILIELFREKSVTMSDLSVRISRNPSTVTALVKKLVDMGFAQSKKSVGDRRQTVIELTESGRRLERSFLEISERLSGPWHAGISSEELAVTGRVLAQARENLREEIAHLQASALSRKDRPRID